MKRTTKKQKNEKSLSYIVIIAIFALFILSLYIVINNSTDSEFYVIDHGATFVPGDPEKSIELAAGPKGDFIYRFGNPCTYDSGDCPSLSNEGQRASNGHQQMFFT